MRRADIHPAQRVGRLQPRAEAGGRCLGWRNVATPRGLKGRQPCAPQWPPEPLRPLRCVHHPAVRGQGGVVSRPVRLRRRANRARRGEGACPRDELGWLRGLRGQSRDRHRPLNPLAMGPGGQRRRALTGKSLQILFGERVPGFDAVPKVLRVSAWAKEAGKARVNSIRRKSLTAGTLCGRRSFPAQEAHRSPESY